MVPARREDGHGGLLSAAGAGDPRARAYGQSVSRTGAGGVSAIQTDVLQEVGGGDGVSGCIRLYGAQDSDQCTLGHGDVRGHVASERAFTVQYAHLLVSGVLASGRTAGELGAAGEAIC